MISESAHGSNVAGIETVAEKDGSEYILNGNKMWITNRTVADIGVGIAKTGPDEGHYGITAFLLPMDTDDVTTEKITDEGIQVYGGSSYVTDYPAERYYHDARITKSYEGTNEIQKNIIADQIL